MGHYQRGRSQDVPFLEGFLEYYILVLGDSLRRMRVVPDPSVSKELFC